MFDKEIGFRMRIIRMKMLLDQAGLGRLLGVSQHQISDLETGRRRIADFDYGRFVAVFGRHANYVLTGAGAESYNAGHYSKRYWKSRLTKKGKAERARQASMSDKEHYDKS